MDKKVIDFGKKEESFDFAGNKIVVRPLSLTEQIAIINQYVEEYFFPNQNNKSVPRSAFDRTGAEYALIVAVVDLCTNINIYSETANGEKELGLDVDGLISSGLWDELQERIANFYHFEMLLHQTVNDIKEELALNKSVGAVLDGLVSKVIGVLEKLSDADTSPEALDKIKEIMSDFSNGLKNTPVGALVAEARK